MRVRVDEGVYVDFYNLHTDAGYFVAFSSCNKANMNRSKDDDIKARSANLQQLSDYIKVNSVGNAVLVFGDTNARYTRTGDNIRVFQTQNGMVNPWVELILKGAEPAEGGDSLICENPSTTNNCETVDKILYVP